MDSRKQCKRCLLGTDNDGDGNCGLCAHLSASTAAKVREDVRYIINEMLSSKYPAYSSGYLGR